MTTDLDKLAALAGAATPGPWEAPPGRHGHPLLVRQTVAAGKDRRWVADVRLQPDAAYIAAASPSVVLALIERVRRHDELVRAARWIVNIHADNSVIKARDSALWEDLDRLRKALPADPHDAHDDEAAARWTAARIDGGVGQ